MTVHDLAADWAWMSRPGVVGFVIGNTGRGAIWEEAEYTARSEGLVRIGRVVTGRGVRAVTKHVEPTTPVYAFAVRDPATDAINLERVK